MVSECTAHADRICAACLGLPACQHGYFREGCGNGNEGQCVPCRATLPGFYRVECGPTDHLLEGGNGKIKCAECQNEYFRDGCTGLSRGICKKCEDCGPDFWRNCGNLSRGDVFYEPGECKQCQNCGIEKFLTGCGFLNAGTCQDCTKCSKDEYMASDCTNSADRACLPCVTSPSCPAGQYRRGCGFGQPGECIACPLPPENFYHVQCQERFDSPGRDVRCGACEVGHFRYNCGAASPGSCELCGACNAGEYRMSCGTWTDPGHCEPCPQCPSEYYLVGCGGLSGGSCVQCTVCGAHEYQVLECNNDHNRACALCSGLPKCDAGFYRADCGSGSPGTCKMCGECPDGSFRQGCEGESPGHCAACEPCPEGQYRFGCTHTSDGECRPCADCTTGSYRIGCSGSQEGHCEPCDKCGAPQYENIACVNTGSHQHNSQNLPCDSLSCEPGSYRKGCGFGPHGDCTICPDSCAADQFLVGCGGQDAGVCGPCALDCPVGPPVYQYRKNCRYLSSGQCEDCPVCPDGFFRKGCGGLHVGACIACSSVPCFNPNQERVNCGGFSEGECIQKWLEFTPPPETILWGKWLTENPTPDCVDNGGNVLPGVVRKFSIPLSILRLAACKQASASGRYTLQARGNWLVSFYVGVPQFSERAVDAPAGYPFEKDGQPDPTDFLEITINGYTQKFMNVVQEVSTTSCDLNKLVFYHVVEDAQFIDFKFVWQSSNTKHHLHLFGTPGTAAYVGDLSRPELFMSKALARLEPTAAKMKGEVVNAVDGNGIFPGAVVKSGYAWSRKTVRLTLCRAQQADVKLLVGSTDMNDLALDKQGKFDVDVKAGKYACHASYPGFYTAFSDNCQVDIKEGLKQTFALCPYLNPGHGRFIMTWGEQPKDMVRPNQSMKIKIQGWPILCVYQYIRIQIFTVWHL